MSKPEITVEVVKSQCKHLNTVINPEDTIGYCTCNECGMEVCVTVLFNNMLDEMRKVLKEARAK